jgi:hypothetical protein
MSRGYPVTSGQPLNYEPHTEETADTAGEALANAVSTIGSLSEEEPRDVAPMRAKVEAVLAGLEAEEAVAATLDQCNFGLTSGASLHGSLSNEELMQWVAQHNDKLNGNLRDLMTSADDRLKLAEDFTNVKALIGAKLDKETAKAAAEAMIAAYEGTPYEQEVRDVLEPVVASLAHRIEKYPKDPLPEDTLSTTRDPIQGAIDSIQKQDQLDMIAIQDLTSQIRENTQLVSNMISSINQTTMSIIGNVGRA